MEVNRRSMNSVNMWQVGQILIIQHGRVVHLLEGLKAENTADIGYRAAGASSWSNHSTRQWELTQTLFQNNCQSAGCRWRFTAPSTNFIWCVCCRLTVLRQLVHFKQIKSNRKMYKEPPQWLLFATHPYSTMPIRVLSFISCKVYMPLKINKRIQ